MATYPFRGHAGTKALESCGIPCAVWGEDLLRHFGVPTIIFDHFLLVPNPETAASELESFGFHSLPSESAVPFPGRVNSQLDSAITRVGPTHRRSPSRRAFTCRCMAFLDEPHPAALCSYRIIH